MQELSVPLQAGSCLFLWKISKSMPYVFLNSPLKKHATHNCWRWGQLPLSSQTAWNSAEPKGKLVYRRFVSLMAGALPAVLFTGDGCVGTVVRERQVTSPPSRELREGKFTRMKWNTASALSVTFPRQTLDFPADPIFWGGGFHHHSCTWSQLSAALRLHLQDHSGDVLTAWTQVKGQRIPFFNPD